MKFLIAVMMFILLAAQPANAASLATASQFDLLEKIKTTLQSLLATISNPASEVSPANLTASVVTAGTGVGQRAQLKTTLSSYSLRSSARIEAGSIGKQPWRAIGTITHIASQRITTYPPGCNTQEAAAITAISCTPQVTSIKWARINFDSGIDGWVEHKYVAPAFSLKAAIGSEVSVTKTTPVLSAPNGSSVGSRNTNAYGKVVDSPVLSGNKIWWKVDFPSGTDGWIDEASLRNYAKPLTSPSPTVVYTPFSELTTVAARDNYAQAFGYADFEKLRAVLKEQQVIISDINFQEDKDFVAIQYSDIKNQTDHTVTLILTDDKFTGEAVTYHNDGSKSAKITLDENLSSEGVYFYITEIDTNNDSRVDELYGMEVITNPTSGNVTAILTSYLNERGEFEVVELASSMALVKEYQKIELPQLEGFPDNEEIDYLLMTNFGTEVEHNTDGTITIYDGSGSVRGDVNTYVDYSSSAFWYQDNTRAQARYDATFDLADYYYQMFITKNGAHMWE